MGDLKIRLLVMGTLVTILALILLTVRAFRPQFIILLCVGVGVLVAGILRPRRR